jgi:DNA-binding transcriptional regulator YdaS (Cro superfamily)
VTGKTMTRHLKNLTAARYASVRRAFPSDAALADMLGVHRSRVSRWGRGATPDPEHAQQLLGLDMAISLLSGFLEPDSVPEWLLGINAHLGHRRPVDVILEGKLSHVVAAIEAEKSGAYA